MLFFIIFLFPAIVSAKAKSSIVMDVNSKRILYKNNIDDKRLIASTTKIMTFLVAADKLPLDKVITVGDEVNSAYGSNTYIEKGEEISVKDLLYGLMLRSGNDCAIVLSHNIKDFVPSMNSYAKKIGMNNTSFKNPTGLDDYDDKNYSTSYDMALLSRYAYKNKFYRKVINTYKYTLETNKKSYIWYNRNKLLKNYKYLVGGKTGFTPKAGRTLVSVASKNNLILTMVSLNDPNHYEDQKKTYEYLFSKYKNKKLVSKGFIRIPRSIFNGKVYVKEDFYYPLTNDEEKSIKLIYKIYRLKHYNDNSKVGYVDVKLYNKTIKKINIYIKKKTPNRHFLIFSR